MSFLPFAVSAWLFAVAIVAMIVSRNLPSLIMSLVVTQSSAYVLLLAIGYIAGAAPPVFAGVPSQTPAADPVVQALTLTDIVVEATVSALLLTFAVRAHQRFGTLDPDAFVPLAPAIPLAVAAALAAASTQSRGRALARVLAIGTAAGVTGMCLALLVGTDAGMDVYWFGGWRSRPGVAGAPGGVHAIGIDFAVDPLGAGMASLAGVLVTAALIFSWRYFEEEGELFDVLVLAFLAAIVAFSVTGDIFDLFVFFDLMGVCAYAPTAYRVEDRGYGAGGAELRHHERRRGVRHAHRHRSRVCTHGHAEHGADRPGAARAPSGRAPGHGFRDGDPGPPGQGVDRPLPVLARRRPRGRADARLRPLLRRDGRARPLRDRSHLVDLLLTGVRGARHSRPRRAIRIRRRHRRHRRTVLAQHHIKRLLAFSTIALAGMLLCGLAVFTPLALAGAGVYVLAHGLVKGALSSSTAGCSCTATATSASARCSGVVAPCPSPASSGCWRRWRSPASRRSRPTWARA